MHRFIRLAALSSVAFIASCATIMHGTTQDVGISSTPSSAQVTVDNVVLGPTPVIAKMKRGDNHMVKIELTGYLPFEATVTKKTSGWVWGNIVFGGLIGLVVDASTGGLYNLTPEQIAGQMAQQHAVTSVSRDGVYVFVVMEPDPSWQQIGSLAAE